MASDDEASALRCRVGNAERGVDRLAKVREAAERVVRRYLDEENLAEPMADLDGALDAARGAVGDV
jgi:hypothetical protein